MIDQFCMDGNHLTSHVVVIEDECTHVQDAAALFCFESEHFVIHKKATGILNGFQSWWGLNDITFYYSCPFYLFVV